MMLTKSLTILFVLSFLIISVFASEFSIPTDTDNSAQAILAEISAIGEVNVVTAHQSSEMQTHMKLRELSAQGFINVIFRNEENTVSNICSPALRELSAQGYATINIC